MEHSDNRISSESKQPSEEFSSSRRKFLGNVGGAAALAAIGLSPLAGSKDSQANAQDITPQKAVGPLSGRKRRKEAYNRRLEAADEQKSMPLPDHPDNGDDERYANKIGSYSKGLPHNNLGEVDLNAYASLIRALERGRPSDFEAITMGLGNKLTNPQSGLAFEMEGPDSHALALPPAPAFASAEEAGEMAENYWMALTRDVPFSEYSTNPLTIAAAADLSRMTDFRGPKSGGNVTPATLFRGLTPGDLTGPYISQFLWRDTPFGAEAVDRQMRTTVPGLDYMTNYTDWLAIENGFVPGPNQFDPIRRYIRNGRDLGEWVHVDVLFQAYFNALLILFSLNAPLDQNNPYLASQTQIGFGTLGAPYFASVLAAVARPALKAVWYQKWFVHRRLRPEVFGGRIHNHRNLAASYPIHTDILNSAAMAEVFSRHGTYLLPMAFPEGSPTHPAYGAGHATVAGACVTILKALFDESFILPNPIEATADGLSLAPFTGPPLTVGGELNKLASNVAIGRNIAGVHWRSDATESLKLGEEVAIRFLRDERHCFNEQFAGFRVTRFDGTTITI
jgi:hypothetical protein